MRYSNMGLTAVLFIGVAMSSSAIAATRVYMNTGPVVATPVFMLNIYRVGCVVKGIPVEFPNDLVLSKTGAAVIPAGHKVKWVINSPHKEGIYTFTAPLANGAHVFVNNAFAGGVGAGMPCTTYVAK